MTKFITVRVDSVNNTSKLDPPVLKMSEAHEHPHNRLRSTFVDANGALQPRPAPRFSRTPTEVGSGPAKLGEHSDEILREVRYSDDEIALLRAKQAVC